MPTNGENLTNEAADDRLESALLQRVLDLHPNHLTTDELIRDLVGEEPDFAARDSIDRAIRELTGACLLHRSDGDLIAPTRPTVRIDELLGPLT